MDTILCIENQNKGRIVYTVPEQNNQREDPDNSIGNQVAQTSNGKQNKTDIPRI